MITAAQISLEIQEMGLGFNSISEVYYSSGGYPELIPILLKYLRCKDMDDNLKEMIVRSLIVKEAKGIANNPLIDEYLELGNDKMLLKWAIGSAFMVIIQENDLARLEGIIKDKSNGISRQMFVSALYKVKNRRSEAILLDAVEDPDISAHAIDALGRIGNVENIEVISRFTNSSNKLVKKEALKAIAKLNKKLQS